MVESSETFNMKPHKSNSEKMICPLLEKRKQKNNSTAARSYHGPSASTSKNSTKQANSKRIKTETTSNYDNIKCPKCGATGMKCPALSAVKDMEEKCFVCKSEECDGRKCLPNTKCCYGCHLPSRLHGRFKHSSRDCPAKNLRTACACRSCHAPTILKHEHRVFGGNNTCLVKDRIRRLLLEHAAKDVNVRRGCLQSACESEKGWFEAMHNCIHKQLKQAPV